MNEDLRRVYERTVELLRADPRVLAAFMTGSVGTSREDAYSDVDPLFLVRPEAFADLDRDLPSVFARAGIEPFLWWPERINTDTLRNYAVLFEARGRPVQYDITIAAAPEGQVWTIRPDQLIFDKAGVLRVTPPAAEPAHPPVRLRWHVEIYWIYAYIHAKYLQRGDPFRLAAAQQELLQAHVTILHALHPEVGADWWPVVAAQFTEPGEREALLAYFGPVGAAAVAAALPGQTARFAAHARAACAKWGVEYPEAAEAAIRPYVEAVVASLRAAT
jgi:predicted nucleotidyltransferase